MRLTRFGFFAALALHSACAREHARGDVAAQDAGRAPLPEPEQLDYAHDDGTCINEGDPLSPLAARRVVMLDESQSYKGQVHARGHDSAYSGTVERLELRTPEEEIEELQLYTPLDGYRSAILSTGDRTLRLVSRTQSLGLRKGMSVNVVERYVDNIVLSFDYRLTLESDGEVVYHYEFGAFIEDLRLPDQLQAERVDVLCDSSGNFGGELSSLRISNREGKSIVLEPGQARTLGDYDIYLWNALYPLEGHPTLAGFDNRTAITEIAVVRR